MKQLLILFGFLMLFIACETPLYFEEPQPTNRKSEKKFDRKYLGQYQSASDKSTFLDIEKNKITVKRFWEVKRTKADLDTLGGYEWRNDKLYYSGKIQNTTIKGDTIIINGTSKEVIFKIDKNSVLKKYQKIYFLNENFRSGWEVKKLQLTNENKLILSKISTKEEIKYLNSLTEIDSIMVSDTSDNIKYYKANPTKSEFENILNGDFFTVEDIYVKVK